MEFITNSVSETIEIGKKIGSASKAGDIICIEGELGSGKTHLTKGIALGLGINEHITSPTFTLVNEYTGRLKLYHFDVYRIDDPAEIEAIGFDEYIFSDAVSVIEWSDLIRELIPEEHIQINISKDSASGDNFRRIKISWHGKRYDFMKEIL
ncbi:MAG: tRNA (adenosine(37)-N6)-threonylcarbamoyltransferase complex ATPase subunit type 1 TsaE [Clostridiaceae bacterium]